MLKAQDEDKRLSVDAQVASKGKVPPAPIICLSTFDKIIVQPRNFEPISNETVSWYRIFASQVSGPNSKARISDYSFPGSGEQV